MCRRGWLGGFLRKFTRALPRAVVAINDAHGATGVRAGREVQVELRLVPLADARERDGRGACAGADAWPRQRDPSRRARRVHRAAGGTVDRALPLAGGEEGQATDVSGDNRLDRGRHYHGSEA